MPQMMPCSWVVIFLGSVIFFLLLNSSFSAFFFIQGFPVKTRLLGKSKTFWS